MIFLDNLRKFDGDSTADDKAEMIWEYLKEMKDVYEASFKNFEGEIKAASDEITSLKSKISALQTSLADLSARVEALE